MVIKTARYGELRNSLLKLQTRSLIQTSQKITTNPIPPGERNPMTETLYKSSDVPDFDTYPSQHTDHLLKSPALVQRAQQIGSALGKTVKNLRSVRSRFQELAGQTAQTAVARVNDLAETIKAKAEDASQAAMTRASELGDAITEKAGQLGGKAKLQYFRARRRANQISRNYPVHTLVAAGVVGVLIGVGIRLWRANRAY
jgi:hypothetical protein